MVAPGDDADANTMAGAEQPTIAAGQLETGLGGLAEELEGRVGGGGEREKSRSRLRLSPGDEVGHFIVEETIGQGGMGVVVAAHDPDLDRRVALKLLRPRQPPR